MFRDDQLCVFRDGQLLFRDPSAENFKLVSILNFGGKMFFVCLGMVSRVCLGMANRVCLGIVQLKASNSFQF